MQMDGLSGKTGWRWIFIMEGIVGFVPILRTRLNGYTTLILLKITCIASFFAYFFLVDFPEKADQSWNFLSKEERDFVIRRINKDRDDANLERFTVARFLKPALDIKIWILALISL